MSVLIEFIKATDKRAKGERIRVDEGSARSFVEKKKVAKRISEKDLETPVDVDDDGDEDDADETVENDTTVTDTAGGAS